MCFFFSKLKWSNWPKFIFAPFVVVVTAVVPLGLAFLSDVLFTFAVHPWKTLEQDYIIMPVVKLV
jgi:hypothetical protein